MTMKALIVQGGWPGHEPKETADIMEAELKKRGLDVEMSDSVDSLGDAARLKELDLIVPHWTMGEINNKTVKVLAEAVNSGLSMAGIHGGMGDAFRANTKFQEMVGGQFVAHPGGAGTTYEVNIVDREHPVTKGLSDFTVTSEQYYMHVDPGNRVLATTNFGEMVMPVSWVRKVGKGNIYYCSLGHNAEHLSQPEALELCVRGLVWAAELSQAAKA